MNIGCKKRERQEERKKENHTGILSQVVVVKPSAEEA